MNVIIFIFHILKDITIDWLQFFSEFIEHQAFIVEMNLVSIKALLGLRDDFFVGLTHKGDEEVQQNNKHKDLLNKQDELT